jgi:hypothetical protein
MQPARAKARGFIETPAGCRIRSQGNYCLPPAGGRIRSQGNYCLPSAGVLHSQNKVINCTAYGVAQGRGGWMVSLI